METIINKLLATKFRVLLESTKYITRFQSIKLRKVQIRKRNYVLLSSLHQIYDLYKNYETFFVIIQIYNNSSILLTSLES